MNWIQWTIGCCAATAFTAVVAAAEENGVAPLDRVQRGAVEYFWSGAEVHSGLARERIHLDEPEKDATVVTIGGTGFGIQALIAGIERGWIEPDAGLERFERIVTFLEDADRFHGVWPHWLYGDTGRVKPFSPKDDGADLVETAFRVCFAFGNTTATAMRHSVNSLTASTPCGARWSGTGSARTGRTSFSGIGPPTTSGR